MDLMRNSAKVAPEPWARYKYNLTTALGERGTRLTGCEEHRSLSRQIACEGMVLLENNGFLPLKEGTCVALFGIGSLDYVKGGGGSGRVYSAYSKNLYQGFLEKSPRISIYEPVTAYYYDYAAPLLADQEEDVLFDEIPLPKELIRDAAQNADVAVITIHRFSGEAWDRSSDKGDFYLTDTEQQMVTNVTSAFNHSVVVLNVGGMVDVSWIKENPKIDGALLAWQAGMEGGAATADILCGDVCPSGKLTDTFARKFSDYPSADTFAESDDYVCYYEDIYVGYRYFETIPGVKDLVNYPFGYGLSYTTFEISAPKASLEHNQIQICVSVTNTGAAAGKEVVQIYYSAPQGRLGKSAVTLAAFQKTHTLAPGETENLTLSFPVSSMASYDDLGKCRMSAYVLEQGEYRFFAGNSCRNLKEADYRYQVTEDFIVTRQLSQKCAPNKLDKRLLADGSFEALPHFPVKDYDIPAFQNPEKPLKTDTPIPLRDVKEGRLSLNAFVTQLTEEELIQLMSGIANRGLALTCGMGGIDRLGIPPVMTADGPAGVRLAPKMGIPTTAWPCATLVACTWDPKLAQKMGAAGAAEMKENGLAIWLTPALNIHRNPLCGRNFEYFSEDPLVAGLFAAAKVKGIQSMGIAACPKHFACNNRETNRKYSDSRVSERALREIYLKGFEICTEKADPWTIMNSYNLINSRRCCESYEQMEGILRGEWNYQGMVMTDWNTPCDQVGCVLSGNDVRMPAGEPKVLQEGLRNGRLKRGHLEKCAMRLLAMILKLD